MSDVDLKNKEAEEWSTDALTEIIPDSSSEKELDDEWQKWNDMPRDQQRLSDWKSLELYGVSNKERYESQKSKFLRLEQSELEQNIDDKDTHALAWCADANKHLVLNRHKTLSDLESSWVKWNEMPKDHRRESDWKSIELYGKTNQERYEQQKSVFLRYDEVDAEDIPIETDISTTTPVDISEGTTLVEFPMFTPDEMIDKKVYRSGVYSDPVINMGSINSKEWFDAYSCMFSGFDVVNKDEVMIERLNKLTKLCKEYSISKEIGENVSKLKQSILELGWDADVPFTSLNRVKASRRISNIIKERFEKYDFIDVTDYDGLEEASSPKGNLKPIYIVFLESDSLFGKSVKMLTNRRFSHVSVGFDHTLNNLYSYNFKHGGFSEEGLKKYEDVKNLVVFSTFISTDKVNRIKKVLKEHGQHKQESNYSVLHLFTIPMKIDYNAGNFSMVCSQFVDSILKIADVNVTKSSSNLVQPYDLFSGATRKKTIFKVYNGPVKKFDPKKIESFVNNKINEFSSTITESNSLPIQFDDNGDLLIRSKYGINFEKEYANCHKLLMNYESSGNYEGMKNELCKLWYMNGVIEERVHDKSTSSHDKKELHKVRARILNDFNKYMKILLKQEPDFNFTIYFENSPYNDKIVRVKKSTLDYSIDYIKKILRL